jgi:catechol 2,3-dioxygenase-like lactoylglutathione lyase family enzyme
MEPQAVNRIQVELHVSDVQMALDFYGALGFKTVWHRWEGDELDYLVMEREGAILNFWPGQGHVWGKSYFSQFPRTSKPGYGVEIVIGVKDIEAYYEKVKVVANIVDTLKLRPWGLKDFRIEDPFGYYLRMTQPYDVTNPKWAAPKKPKRAH